MNILITTGIFPPDIGGPATQLKHLIKEILSRNPDFKITVLTFGSKKNSKIETEEYKIIKISKNIPRPFRNFFYFTNTLRLGFKSDIIYSWDLYAAGFFSFLTKKIFPGKKLIIRFVGDSAWERYFNKFSTPSIRDNFQFSIPDNIIEFQNKKYGLRIEFKKWLRKKMLASADFVVVPSEFMKEIAIKIGVDNGRIRIINNSVEYLFGTQEIEELKKIDKEVCKKNLGFNENGINLVSVSRLVPWKGQECLIEIMPDLIKKYENVFLYLIGDGPEFNKLKSKISNLKLENNVFLIGKLSHSEVFKYLKCADMFILNTAYEGMSHTILEAITVGIPVITTNIPSNKEVIEDGINGFLTDYNDKGKIFEAIQKIIENPDLKNKFSTESKKKLECFKFEDLVLKTVKMLKEV